MTTTKEMKQNQLAFTLHSARGYGHTDYMLRAALKNPQVNIICRDQGYADDLAGRYEMLMEERPWYEKTWEFMLSVFGYWRPWPNFVSINRLDTIRGVKRPIMIDNGTMLDILE